MNKCTSNCIFYSAVKIAKNVPKLFIGEFNGLLIGNCVEGSAVSIMLVVSGCRVNGAGIAPEILKQMLCKGRVRSTPREGAGR